MFLSSVAVLRHAGWCSGDLSSPLPLIMPRLQCTGVSAAKRSVDTPSLEVFKSKTKCSSVHNGFDADLLIRKNRLDFSVKVRFRPECC